VLETCNETCSGSRAFEAKLPVRTGINIVRRPLSTTESILSVLSHEERIISATRRGRLEKWPTSSSGFPRDPDVVVTLARETSCGSIT